MTHVRQYLTTFLILCFFFFLQTPNSNSAREKRAIHFTIRHYSIHDHVINAHYFKHGATRYEISSKTKCIDLTVAGYKVWSRGLWEPIDYLEIERNVISGINPRKPLPYMYLVETEQDHRIRLRVCKKFKDIPRRKIKKGIIIHWIIATGPVFTQKSSEVSINTTLRKSRIRPWDYAARNAMFIAKEGTSFALVSHYGTIREIISYFNHHKEYYYLVMFDGGSASSPYAQNPVWITIHKKK